jgi:transposase
MIYALAGSIDRMFDSNDDTRPRRPRRIEVFTGPQRRRDWPDERKIAIVSESLAPGVNVSELARRHEINPQQLFGWRRRFRADAEALIAARSTAPACFAPIVVEAPVASAVVAPPEAAGVNDGSIEIAIGSATVRIRGAVDLKTLALVFKAVKVLL